MTSTLVAVLDNIESLVEALTPPTWPRVTYERVNGRLLEQDRAFMFPSTNLTSESNLAQNAGLAVHLYSFEMRMRRNTSELGAREAIEAVVNEADLIQNTISTGTGFPSGSRGTLCTGWETEDADSDDLTIIFALTSECEETDGVS